MSAQTLLHEKALLTLIQAGELYEVAADSEPKLLVAEDESDSQELSPESACSG